MAQDRARLESIRTGKRVFRVRRSEAGQRAGDQGGDGAAGTTGSKWRRVHAQRITGGERGAKAPNPRESGLRPTLGNRAQISWESVPAYFTATVLSEDPALTAAVAAATSPLAMPSSIPHRRAEVMSSRSLAIPSFWRMCFR